MIWGKATVPLPQRGTHRQRQRFAWWPVHLSSGYWLWFEGYQQVEEYGEIPGTSDTMSCGYAIGWHTIKRW